MTPLETKLAIIADKLLLGFTLAAPIGPVSVEMIKRGLRHGFLSAFSVRLGGALGNLICLLAAYYGIAHILAYPQLLNSLGIIGACLLIYMGWTTLRKGIDLLDLEGEIDIQNGMRWGLYLAVVNPVAFVFWPGIFAASIDPATGSTGAGLFQNLLIILGVVLWGAGLSTVLAFGHSRLNKKVILRISQGSALLMFYFGFKYLWVILERLI